MTTVRALWRRRSRRATAVVCSGRKRPQDSKGHWEATPRLRRSCLEDGKQAGRRVALVVVGVALDLASSERQHRRHSVERLGLLIEGQDDRPLGRGEVEPDNVADSGLERLVRPAFGG